MDKKKLIEVIKTKERQSNKTLKDGLVLLSEEFEKTKELLINLSRHLESVENHYETIKEELKNRGAL